MGSCFAIICRGQSGCSFPALQCGLPESQSFSFRVEAGFPLLADMGPGVGRVPAMNGAAHFQKMKDRRVPQGE